VLSGFHGVNNVGLALGPDHCGTIRLSYCVNRGC
jgi:hypothetical protein